MKPIKFKSVLTESTGEYGGLYFPVPREVAEKFEVKNGTRRVVCTANGKLTFQCAVLPNSKGFYIGTNKSIRDTLGLQAGDEVKLELAKDDSKYGCPMPEEFQEVLNQDPEGDKFFHSLTPGKQRSLLYFVGSVKDIDKRINTALKVIEHLKRNNGKLVHETFHDELKRPSF
jgi:bifunctional DNA-binding transcriptional regulator/antitoxin component of YhaV-PrlF toxin-antitoxin module